MSIVCVITARGGSKRIPKKNIKDFMGQPMIAYAIKAAWNSKIFDEIMVSTESDEIANIAQSYGASVPFMRSLKNADDYASTNDVLNEVLSEYEKRGKSFDELCCIYPCVPLLDEQILRDAYAKFKSQNANKLVPVVRFSFPIQRAFRVNEKGFLEYREPESAPKRSQDLEPMYHDAGMFYFYKTKALNENSAALMYEMSEGLVQDIDNPEDWRMAEIKYKVLKNV